MNESGRSVGNPSDARQLKDPQIGGNLTQDEARDLKAYAAIFQLTLNQLGFLLVIRELNLERLPDLAVNFTQRVAKARRKRVTTRPKNPFIKIAFVEHAGKHDMGSDEAASIIFRAELSERWLLDCVGSNGESPLIPQLS